MKYIIEYETKTPINYCFHCRTGHCRFCIKFPDIRGNDRWICAAANKWIPEKYWTAPIDKVEYWLNKPEWCPLKPAE